MDGLSESELHDVLDDVSSDAVSSLMGEEPDEEGNENKGIDSSVVRGQ